MVSLDLRDHRPQLRLELVEQTRDLARASSGLEVVEQHVVCAVEAVEAIDVPANELEVLFQVRDEPREVRCLTRRYPSLLTDRRSARHVGGELGGHAACLVPLAAGHPDQRRFIGVGRSTVEIRSRGFDQTAGFVGDEHFVADLLHGRDGLGPSRRPAAAASSSAGPSPAAGRRSSGPQAPPSAGVAVQSDLTSVSRESS